MKLLVTGGAGYIGSHTVRQLVAAGHDVTVLDNLVYGHPESIVDDSVCLIVGDLGDRNVIEPLFAEKSFDAVIHFAAYAYVGESVSDPLKYYQNNLSAPVTLLQVMQEYEVKQFVFSSTCATYGVPDEVPIAETQNQAPINPYGASKWMLERVLRDCETAWGLRSVFLRYFNAAGCSFDGAIGEDHDPETHLIPLVLDAISGKRDAITVFGTDYPTPDGTCIRDYIHVDDLADAHLRAVDYLSKGGTTDAFNLGTGRGLSVKEIIDAASKVSGKEVPVIYGDRREGDPPQLIADPSKAKNTLGWVAQHQDAHTVVKTAWNWHQNPKW